MAGVIDAQDGLKRNPPIEALFTNSEYINGLWHTFPTTAEALRAELENVGGKLELGAPLQISMYNSEIPGLEKRLPKRVDPDELNYLAATLQAMPLQELAIFRGALDEGLYCDSMKSLINLACNVGEWMDAPEVFTDGQLGRFAYDNGLLSDEERDAATIHLQTSYCPDEYFASLGEKYRITNNGFFTSYGYSENLGVTDMQIPEESRLFAMADAALFPFHKSEKIDLADFMIKAHALAGEHLRDVEYAVGALREGTDYIMVMNSDRMIFTETVLTCMAVTAAHSASRLHEDDGETRAFLLHVEDRKGGSIIGNVVAVDYAALKRDIDANMIQFINVEALMKDGTTKHFTVNEYQALEQIERDNIRTRTYRHDPADLAALESHIPEYYRQAAKAARAVTANDLLEALNRSFMEQAVYSFPDMLRIPRQVAKDMILGSHAPVYRIMPGGPAELGPKDVILSGGGLWYQFNREFALKKSDCWDGLNKWSKATAARLIPDRQRDAKKSHDAR